MNAFFLALFIGLIVYGFNVWITTTSGLIAWCIGCALGAMFGEFMFNRRNNVTKIYALLG